MSRHLPGKKEEKEKRKMEKKKKIVTKVIDGQRYQMPLSDASKADGELWRILSRYLARKTRISTS